MVPRWALGRDLVLVVECPGNHGCVEVGWQATSKVVPVTGKVLLFGAGFFLETCVTNSTQRTRKPSRTAFACDLIADRCSSSRRDWRLQRELVGLE
jgi:hypothetical protein